MMSWDRCPTFRKTTLGLQKRGIPMAYGNSLVLALFAFAVVASRASSQSIPADVQCLLDFKRSVTDPGNNLATWKESDAANVCFWDGVQCFGNLELPIYRLLLSRFGLSSPWPMALAECTGLQTIDLSYNSFTGPLPMNMSVDFPNLVTLTLHHNGFSGLIPASLGDCNYLNDLLLNDNSFSGEIPAHLAAAPRLSQLNLANNQLSGVIPSALAVSLPGTNKPKFNASSFGGNLYLCGSPLLNPCRKLPEKGTSKTGAIVGGIVGSVVAFLTSLAVGIWWHLRHSRSKAKIVQAAFARRRKPSRATVPFTENTKWLKRIRDPSTIAVAMFDNPTSRIGFKELMQGTSNFSSENVLSTNSVGTLYKATLNDGSLVAIRRLRAISHNDKAFRTEMEALGNLKHRNLVPLLGYCVAAGERLLVYQHMPAGSLWDRLHCGFEKMPWADRVKVATGAARGLAFLHHSCNPRVLHRNVNAKAILLEDDNEPRITDFGLARLTNPHDTHVSTFFNGDYGDAGYVAPEVAHSFQATMKGDVYSFGVVLLELVTGRKATDVVTRSAGSSSQDDFRGNLVQYVTSLSSQAAQAVDPSMKEDDRRPTDGTTHDGGGSGVDEEILQILKVAMSCVSAEPKERPNMFEVEQLLRAIGHKYEFTTSAYGELPTLPEETHHVDVHETFLVEVQFDK